MRNAWPLNFKQNWTKLDNGHTDQKLLEKTASAAKKELYHNTAHTIYFGSYDIKCNS